MSVGTANNDSCSCGSAHDHTLFIHVVEILRFDLELVFCVLLELKPLGNNHRIIVLRTVTIQPAAEYRNKVMPSTKACVPLLSRCPATCKCRNHLAKEIMP